MLPITESYAGQYSRERIRGLIFGAAVLAIASAVLLLWTTPSARPFGLDGKPDLPVFLWTTPYETPSSYRYTAETNTGEVRVWANAPDSWHFEDRGQRVQVSDGEVVWEYVASEDAYYGIPFIHAIEAGATAPLLQDGRPIYYESDTWVSTRRPFAGYLGPMMPEALRSSVEYAHEHGKWSLTTGTYLGREVYILYLEVRDVPRDVDGFPFEATFTIDPQYLFVLAYEQTMLGAGADDAKTIQRLTEITYNQPIPDAVFDFVPPEGSVECLPPQFKDRGDGCFPR